MDKQAWVWEVFKQNEVEYVSSDNLYLCHVTGLSAACVWDASRHKAIHKLYVMLHQLSHQLELLPDPKTLHENVAR